MTAIDIERLYAAIFPDTPLSTDPENPICDLLDEIGEIDHLLLDEVFRVAEGGGSPCEWLQQIVLNSAGGYVEDPLASIKETHLWLKVHLGAAELLSGIAVTDSVIDTDAPYLSYAASQFLKIADITEPSSDQSAAATVIAYVVGEPHGEVSTLPSVIVAEKIGYLASRLPEVEMILPELKRRRSYDRGTIEALLKNKVAVLREGEL